MLKSLVPLLLVITSLFPAARKAPAQPCSTPSRQEALATLRSLNEQYIEAARTGNARWFADHMAEDVLVILGSGIRVSKAEFLRRLVEEPRGFRSLVARSVTVRAFGATAQVDADAPWELEDGSKGVSRYIDTYAWIDCRWQVISAQITLLPANEADAGK